MFRISDNSLDDNIIRLKIEGQLDEEALPHFRDYLCQYLNQKRKVQIDFSNLLHINLKCKRYLKEIIHLIEIIDLPEYLHLEILSDRTCDISEPRKR
jgi:hypothetical protein